MSRLVKAIRGPALVAGLLASLVGSVFSLPAQAAVSSRYSAIVVDAASGAVLYASAPDVQRYPASLTKIMTLYMAFDALDSGRLSLGARLPVSAHAAAQAPSKLGLRPGETIRVEDAILALVTKSANDAAVVVAEALGGGSEARFAALMTAKARELGMSQTEYHNASGLPDPDQITSARDQALLARAMLRDHPRYYGYFNTQQFVWKGTPITTHNRLMLRYPGADGIKTGYIAASGFNLVSSAHRDGRRIIGVVFGGSSAAARDRQMENLLDEGFARLEGGAIHHLARLDDPAPLADTDEAVAEAPVVLTPPARTSSATLAAARPLSRQARLNDDVPQWGIQVGAFSAMRNAHSAASAAVRELSRLGLRAAVDVDATKRGKKTLYRAKLVGLSEDQARAACLRLKKSCMVLQPS